jgi:hypothetical protein
MLPPVEAPAEGSSDRHPPLGGMLCLPGGSAVHGVPRENPRVHGLPEDDSPGQSDIHTGWMGNI